MAIMARLETARDTRRMVTPWTPGGALEGLGMTEETIVR